MSKETGEVHAPKFGKLMVALLHDLTITDGAKVLYAHMHWRYGKNERNFEGQKSMAELLGVSEKTIRNRTDELEANDWVVTIYTGHNEKGNWDQYHYHVFETQEEGRRFRAEYKPADGHEIKEKPEARQRKSRKGKGNPEPVLPPRQNSGSDTNRQKPSSIGHRNSGSTDRQKPSSEYLDSSYLDSSIQTKINQSSPNRESIKAAKQSAFDDDWMILEQSEQSINSDDKTEVRPKPEEPPLKIAEPPEVFNQDYVIALNHFRQKLRREPTAKDKPTIKEDVKVYGLQHMQTMIDHCFEQNPKLVSYGYIHRALLNKWGTPAEKTADKDYTSGKYADYINNTPPESAEDKAS